MIKNLKKCAILQGDDSHESCRALGNREFTHHDAPADDEPKQSGNERGHAIISQASSSTSIYTICSSSP